MHAARQGGAECRFSLVRGTGHYVCRYSAWALSRSARILPRAEALEADLSSQRAGMRKSVQVAAALIVLTKRSAVLSALR